MSVMLNRARIARYTTFLSDYTLWVQRFPAVFHFFPAQLYNGNIRAGYVKWAHFYACLIRMTAQRKTHG
uniref:Uncharacterized protein n=1 Tax=Pluralibacter gergoviae TaxID=61647 RepID=A0A142I5A0_PLUGE|nr:hypothetical protein LG71_29275 [Pluralibacter gergoviae]